MSWLQPKFQSGMPYTLYLTVCILSSFSKNVLTDQNPQQLNSLEYKTRTGSKSKHYFREEKNHLKIQTIHAKNNQYSISFCWYNGGGKGEESTTILSLSNWSGPQCSKWGKKKKCMTTAC